MMPGSASYSAVRYSRTLLGPANTAVRGRASASVPEPDRQVHGPSRVQTADPATVLRRRFPGLVFWFGTCTRSWWAVVRVPAGWRLVEAVDDDELTRAVLAAAPWPYPPAWRPASVASANRR